MYLEADSAGLGFRRRGFWAVQVVSRGGRISWEDFDRVCGEGRAVWDWEEPREVIVAWLRALLGSYCCGCRRRDADALHAVAGARGVAPRGAPPPPLGGGGRGGGGHGNGHGAAARVRRAAGLGVGRGAVPAAPPRGGVPGRFILGLRGVPARPQPHLRRARRAVGAAAAAARGGGGGSARPGVPTRAHHQDHLQAHPRRRRGRAGPRARGLGRRGPLRREAAPRRA